MIEKDYNKLQRLNATVVGRVQGVGFRFFVHSQARRLNLTGYVQNAQDDRRKVEVVAEGEQANLEKLLKALEKGPFGSKVESVQAHWQAAQNSFSSFEITYYGN